MAFSARTLKENTCSVALLRCLYATCDAGIFLLIFSMLHLIMHIASIFRSTDRIINGLRWPGGPGFSPSLGSSISIPSLISSGKVPISAISLKMSAIHLCISICPHLIISPLKLSIPGLSHFLKHFTAFCISSALNGIQQVHLIICMTRSMFEIFSVSGL